MQADTKRRISGGIGFVVILLLFLSWLAAGFLQLHVGWQLGLGIPLLLVLVDYAFVMLGRDGVFAAVAKLIMSRGDRR